MKGGFCTMMAASLLLALVAGAPVGAQEAEAAEEAKETGWFNATDLSFVATSGNAETTTLGFRNQLRRVWEPAEFSFEVGAVFSEASTFSDRFAVGTAPGAPFVIVEPEKQTNAERYYGLANYRRQISRRLFWNAGADAERNEPAGIEHRYTGVAGLGHNWFPDRKDMSFLTTYNGLYTDEELEVEGSNSFGGLRLTYDYQNMFTESTTFDSELTIDENLDETDDYRVNFYNAISVAVSKRIALKAGLRVLYRHLPPLEAIRLEDGAGNTVGTVLVEREDVDTTFATSLVLNL